jgi:hypothetical protein
MDIGMPCPGCFTKFVSDGGEDEGEGVVTMFGNAWRMLVGVLTYGKNGAMVALLLLLFLYCVILF